MAHTKAPRPDLYATRRENLRALIRQRGGPTTLALRLGHSSGSYLAQLAGPHPIREISEKVARAIEDRLELPAGWLDKPTTLDETVLAACVQAVSAACASSRPDARRFAELIGMAYEHAQLRGGTPDEAFIRRLVRLVE